MKMLLLFVPVCAILLVFLNPSPAHAYLDPGTGSMLYQSVIVGIAAVSVCIGTMRRRIRSFLSKIFGRHGDHGAEKGGN